MRRLSLLCLVMLATTLWSVPAAATQASPPARVTAAPLDLATMLLVPADVKRPHATIFDGGRYFLDIYSGQRAAALKAAGDLGGFEVWLGPPTTDRDYQVASAIDAFTDAHGAAAGYTFLRGKAHGLVSEVPTIGDASYLVRVTGTDPYDPRRSDYGLILVFRLDRLVGEIRVESYTASKPHAAEAIALGEIMAARIKRVLAGDPTKPGLSNQVLRFKLPALDVTFQDAYYRLNGQDLIGWEGDLPKGRPTFAAGFPGATTVFETGQSASSAAGAPWERVRLVQFPTATAASSWAKEAVALFARGAGWQQVKPVAGAKAYGDQSQTVTLQWLAGQGEPGKTVYGTMILARYGALVVSYRIEAYKPVPVTVVEELMTAQVRCLRALGDCPRVTPSPALLALTVSAPSG